MNRIIITAIIILTSLFVSGQMKVAELDTLIGGHSVYQIEMGNYDSLLNLTRTDVGVSTLTRDKSLDSLALVRCFELAEVLYKISDTKELFKKFRINGHKDARYRIKENARMTTPSVRLSKSVLDTLSLKGFKSVMIKYEKTWGDLGEDMNKGYNGSPGHYDQRIYPKHTKYGTSTIVMILSYKNPNYDPNKIMQEYLVYKLIINYECFK